MFPDNYLDDKSSLTLEGTTTLERMAARGWRLFPCASRGKVPLLKSWPTLATSDLVTIRKWCQKYPVCNWGVATGPGSRVFVLDIDGNVGRASLAALEMRHGQLTDTLTSSTGRDDGGEHRWFKYPLDREVRNSAGKLGEGLDIRGAGGYVILPPSTHPSGRVYQWARPEQAITEAPNWILDLLAADGEKPRIPPSERAILTETQRNDGLTRYAGALRRRGAELPELEQRLLEANARRCKPPLDERDVLAIAASIARYPVGGLDPLELAWQITQSERFSSNEARFVGLCRNLQRARKEMDIALPLQKIGMLMNLHWTTVGLFRKQAVKHGVLVPTEQYIAHSLAGRYRFTEVAFHEDQSPEIENTLTSSNYGLVRIPKVPSESPGIGNSSSSENVSSENSGVSPSENASSGTPNQGNCVEVWL